jgi:hypothetical protein
MLKFPSRIGLICSSIACIALVGHPLAAQEKSKIPNALNRTVQDSEEESEPKEKGEDPLMQFPLEPERWIDMAYGALGGTRVSFEQSHRRKVRVTLNQIERSAGKSQRDRGTRVPKARCGYLGPRQQRASASKSGVLPNILSKAREDHRTVPADDACGISGR